MHEQKMQVLQATVSKLLRRGATTNLKKALGKIHPADIAHLFRYFELPEQKTLLDLVPELDQAADVMAELEPEAWPKLAELLDKAYLISIVHEMADDDSAVFIRSLSDELAGEILAELHDEQSEDVEHLLGYDEDTAGGIMGKELIKVYEDWTIFTCVREMRKQAENIDKVHGVYVVDENEILKGILSLKSMLTTSTKTPIKEIYNDFVISVNVDIDHEEVAKIMQKYDLIALPVVDELGRLVGKITIDDVVDIIKDEADKDYQIAAGLTDDVEADDTIFELIKGRLPWLVLGLFGGLGSVFIMQDFEGLMQNDKLKDLFFFTPLIAAMAGNVGVQSSAIIVQGLANDIIKGSLLNRLIKEITLSLINGIVLALLILIFGQIVDYDFDFSVAVAISLISVIIIAALIGTFVPIVLHKRGIDPALATGPFITTSNDIFGIFIFFFIAKMILGF